MVYLSLEVIANYKTGIFWKGIIPQFSEQGKSAIYTFNIVCVTKTQTHTHFESYLLFENAFRR